MRLFSLFGRIRLKICIIYTFRVWRENRDRIVGFPARYHARYDNELYYNSNHTCQFSAILTGAAFIHKVSHKAMMLKYFCFCRATSTATRIKCRQSLEKRLMSGWTVKILQWISLYLTWRENRPSKQPVNGLLSKFQETNCLFTHCFRCPTCKETLSNDDNHFTKRHNCIRFFIEVYGYNPLLFTQFRADSVLFKTRVPNNHQKCFMSV